MATLALSVIIVSRHRPDWLGRCLKAVAQLDYSRFETVVVACPAGASVARDAGTARVVDFDQPNISAARNAGVDAASGDVVLFLDDDAVPEPTWLSHLAAAFDDPDVVQAGGTTLGRNGITPQHGAALVDATGLSHTLQVSSDAPTIVTPTNACRPRLHGTNMALRRAVVQSLGGFDDRFAFYLDETDLTYRVSQAGGKSMFVPKAVVHHASGPSRFRTADRTPQQVFEIAASAAVFHTKHCPLHARDAARDAFLTERRAWLVRHMQNGALPPDRAWGLIRELSAGYTNGLTRTASPAISWTRDAAPWIAERLAASRDLYLVATGRTATDIRARAKTLVAQGARVTVFDYRANARYHRVSFTDDGYWLHTGGVFGRETRSDPIFRTRTRKERVAQTLVRLDGIRSKNPLILEVKT
jgi:GT2 family glycosyltransferase